MSHNPLQPQLPNLFIVGAPKCGTSALYTYLGEHPDIYFPPKKEPHFFAPEWADIKDTHWTLEQYLALFANAGDVRYAGEASVYYLASEGAAAAIHAFNPDAKIIIMLRAPVEMLYSRHYQLIENGSQTALDFAQALALEPAIQQGTYTLERVNMRRLQYRKIARYTEQVQRYFDIFGRGNVHVIIYDDLRADTAKVYQDTLAYLQLPPDQRTDFKIVNPNTHVKSPALNRFMKRPPAWVNHMVQVYKSIMPPQTRQAIRRKLFAANIQPARRPPLDPVLEAQLKADFLPEIEALSNLLGRDLTHWCH